MQGGWDSGCIISLVPRVGLDREAKAPSLAAGDSGNTRGEGTVVGRREQCLRSGDTGQRQCSCMKTTARKGGVF